MQTPRFTDEQALAQLQDYPGYDQDYYRALRDWFRMSPRQALRYFLRERAHQAKSAAQRGDTDSEWEDHR